MPGVEDASSKRLVLAFDIGGTHIRAAAISTETGNMIHRLRENSCLQSGGDLVAQIERLGKAILHQCGVATPHAIGVAIPGPTDVRQGIVLSAPQFPNLWHFPLKASLESAFKMPVSFENDANLAGLGEYKFGAGLGRDPMLYITWSTGIGGGLIIDGKIYRGAHDMGAEIGHEIWMGGAEPVSIEQAIAGPALARRYAAQYFEMHETLPEGSLWDAAQAHDPLSTAVYAGAGTEMGIAVSNWIHAFDPACVVIGGGVSQAWDFWYPTMIDQVQRHVKSWAERNVSIVRAEKGDDAGLLGVAAYLC